MCATLSLRDWPCDILANLTLPRVSLMGSAIMYLQAFEKSVKFLTYFFKSYKRLGNFGGIPYLNYFCLAGFPQRKVKSCENKSHYIHLKSLCHKISKPSSMCQ